MTGYLKQAPRRRGKTERLNEEIGHNPRISGIKYLRKAEIFWYAALLTLPLDIIIFQLIGAGTFAIQQFNYSIYIAPLLIVIGISLSDRTRLLRIWRSTLGSRLTGNYQKNYKRLNLLTWWVHLIPVVILLMVLLSSGNYIPAIIILATLVLSYIRSRNDSDTYIQEKNRRLQSPLLTLDDLNVQLLVFAILPIAVVRAAGSAAALTASSTGSPMLWFITLISCVALMILTLRPKKDDFLTRCNCCGNWASKVFERKGFCPTCQSEGFKQPTGQTLQLLSGGHPGHAKRS